MVPSGVATNTPVVFANPPTIESSGGFLNTTINLDWITVDLGGAYPKEFKTRALAGSVPGPTIVVSPGDTLRVTFTNELMPQIGVVAEETNRYGEPDTANLHFHGGYVSAAADDTTLAVLPGGSYNYVVEIPADHAPGMGWIHPHHHGSTMLHLAGGAAMAMIVRDPADGYLPPAVSGADEKIMVFQYWKFAVLAKTARQARDVSMSGSLAAAELGDGSGEPFFTVNGVREPTLEIRLGEWERWRILYAGWQDTALDLLMEDEDDGEVREDDENCEMQLLAKDGIYIQDFPRRLKKLPIPPGGRADVMVRCSRVGTTFVHVLGQKTLILNVFSAEKDSVSFSETNTTMNPLQAWAPPYRPNYLKDLRDAVITSGCDCPTAMYGYGVGESLINGQLYTPGNHFIHSSFLGATVQRRVLGIAEHSYHQHVYPYQILGFEETGPDDQKYFRPGDWQDTWMDTTLGKRDEVVLRYRPTVFPGKVMVHCHNGEHADLGMIAKEYVRDLKEDDGGKCACNVNGPLYGEGIVDVFDVTKVIEEVSGSIFSCSIGWLSLNLLIGSTLCLI